MNIHNLEKARSDSLKRISMKLKRRLERKSLAQYFTEDRLANIVCLTSKAYEIKSTDNHYWFGFTPSQRKFLMSSSEGFVALICSDSLKTFLIDRETFLGWLKKLRTSPRNATLAEPRLWHIDLDDFGSSVGMRGKSEQEHWDLSEFLVV